MSLITKVSTKYSKSFKYFELYYQEMDVPKLDWKEFQDLDFSFQLGVFILFFNSVSTDVDLFSLEPEALEEAILEAFGTYEEYLFLDS